MRIIKLLNSIHNHCLNVSKRIKMLLDSKLLKCEVAYTNEVLYKYIIIYASIIMQVLTRFILKSKEETVHLQ